MNDFLAQVMEERRRDAETTAGRVSLDSMIRAASSIVQRRSLSDRLRLRSARHISHIIGEVKKASPSAGLLRKTYNPIALAQEYEQAGAIGISVLTEPRYFLGNIEDIARVHKAVGLPVLRKDFISELYQVYESAALGADAILLIAGALDFHLLRELYVVAFAIGLEVVAEVHNTEELEMVLPLAKVIIGVNSRNLKTLTTDLAVARELAPFIPPDRLFIAESGIKTREDIVELESLGYRGFLIGETLLKAESPKAALRQLSGQT